MDDPRGGLHSPTIGMVAAGVRALRETGMSSQKHGEKGQLADERTVCEVYRAMCLAGAAQAIEARRAETLQDGSVDESAVPTGCALNETSRATT